MAELLVAGIIALVWLAVCVLTLRLLAQPLLQRTVSWRRALLAVAAIALGLAGGWSAAILLGRLLHWPLYATSAALLGVALASLVFAPLIVLRAPLAGAAKLAGILGIVTLAILCMASVPVALMVRTYHIPTNGMAPSIIGRHYVGKCPECGGPTIASVDPGWDEDRGEMSQPAPRAICSQCWRDVPTEHVTGPPLSGDRILVRQWATPVRWDAVVFPFPEDPRQMYVKRLVGLPGESIQMKEGGIWINGQRLQPPPHLQLAHWELEDFMAEDAAYACTEPYQLADDECFVLGDNTLRSYDSRFWGPVKRDQLRGVASHVYFPFQSWRTIPRE